MITTTLNRFNRLADPEMKDEVLDHARDLLSQYPDLMLEDALLKALDHLDWLIEDARRAHLEDIDSKIG